MSKQVPGRLLCLAAVLCLYSSYTSPSCSCAHSEAAAHAVATLAEATLQGGGQIVLSGETAAAVGALTGVQDANGLVQIPVSMYQTVVTSLAQGNGPVQVAMAPVTTRISDSAVTMDGQAVEVVTLEQ